MSFDFPMLVIGLCLGASFGMLLVAYHPPKEGSLGWKRMLRIQEVRRFKAKLRAEERGR